MKKDRLGGQVSIYQMSCWWYPPPHASLAFANRSTRYCLWPSPPCFIPYSSLLWRFSHSGVEGTGEVLERGISISMYALFGENFFLILKHIVPNRGQQFWKLLSITTLEYFPHTPNLPPHIQSPPRSSATFTVEPAPRCCQFSCLHNISVFLYLKKSVFRTLIPLLYIDSCL